MMERNSLIGYALSFASFLIDSRIGGKISAIILFGSVARGDYSEESDIDIFLDAEEGIRKEADRLLSLFSLSKANETWRLKGIKNEISLKVGRLASWSLRRDVISSGILLYGKYSQLPEKAKYYLLVTLHMKKAGTAKKMRIWRRLYGYRQKIGKKLYSGKGLVEKLGGKKIGKAVFLIPMEKRNEMLQFLNRNRISYTVNELWSDTL